MLKDFVTNSYPIHCKFVIKTWENEKRILWERNFMLTLKKRCYVKENIRKKSEHEDKKLER